MANPHRGEIEAELDGRRFTLCLTLGALAELEGALGERDLLALAERFEKGRIASRDAIRIIGAGLRGAGDKGGEAAGGPNPPPAGRLVSSRPLSCHGLKSWVSAWASCDLPRPSSGP